MAKKAAAPEKQTTRILNENEAPTIFSNHCELGIITDEFRITFREILRATPSEIVTREMVRVYCNIHVARQLAEMFAKAVRQWDIAHTPAKPSAEKPPSSA